MRRIKLNTSVSGSFSGVKGDEVTCQDNDAEGLVAAGHAVFLDDGAFEEGEGDEPEPAKPAKPAKSAKSGKKGKKAEESTSADADATGTDPAVTE